MAAPATRPDAAPGLVVRLSVDRALLRGFLERDRLYAAYALCDLDDREFGRTRWGVPRAAYLAARTEHLAAISGIYRAEPGPLMVRMWVDRSTFRPCPAEVARLLPVEVGDLNRLYQLGFTAWLPPTAVAEGVYYGIRVSGRLVSAAGTHVISAEARLGVVGNVMTHPDFRGRGYATAVTGAVTADLLRFCDQVVLNVRSDNPPALRAYAKLGYREHVRFEERLIHRQGGPAGPLAALPGPIRRLLGRSET
jgi:ribosomal protein S18 acetylase RimI-like enzyme